MLPCIPQLERPLFSPLGAAFERPQRAANVGLGFESHGRSAAPVEEQAIRVLMLSLGDLALTSGTPAQLRSDMPARDLLIPAAISDTGASVSSSIHMYEADASK